jgi:hypothetical protein
LKKQHFAMYWLAMRVRILVLLLVVSPVLHCQRRAAF